MVDLSLVICTYNNARQLRQALASLAAQRLGGGSTFEVVVVDNNCTDDTGQVVESFAEDHRSFETRLVREAR